MAGGIIYLLGSITAPLFMYVEADTTGWSDIIHQSGYTSIMVGVVPTTTSLDNATVFLSSSIMLENQKASFSDC